LKEKRAIVVPAVGQDEAFLEVHDLKEFTRNLRTSNESEVQRFYKISQKFENHLQSLGVLNRRKRR
jgi:hypothetical protein